MSQILKNHNNLKKITKLGYNENNQLIQLIHGII